MTEPVNDLTLGERIKMRRTAREEPAITEAVTQAQGYTDEAKQWLQETLQAYADSVTDDLKTFLQGYTDNMRDTVRAYVNDQISTLQTAVTTSLGAKTSKTYVDQHDSAIAARIDSLLANNPSLLP